jgi:Mlc titration factor MtfA (ptsG expression regulator)
MLNPSTGAPYESWQELFASSDYILVLIMFSAAAVLLVMPIFYGIKSYKRFYPRALRPEYMLYVGQMSYYQRLSPLEQKRFAIRCQIFINTKTFIPRGGKGFVLVPEMIAKIAASAVEISFGFPKMGFEHFSRILIYPTDYYSRITRQYHKGEVNVRGMIVLSWSSFQDGYAKDDDGINLAIHEMAHALKLENRIENGDYQFLDAQLMKALRDEFQRLSTLQSPAESTLIRAYALTNIHEFFAVLCENFFERPSALQHEQPQLYSIISRLLMQNPLAQNEMSIAPSNSYAMSDFSGPIKRH